MPILINALESPEDEQKTSNDMSHRALGNMPGAELVRIFKSISDLDLDLSWNNLWNKGEELTQALAAIKAASLDLSNNDLGAMSDAQLIHALAAINAVSLVLSHNDLGLVSDAQLIHAFAAIKAQHLNISGNFLRRKGEALPKALAAIKASSLDLSNNDLCGVFDEHLIPALAAIKALHLNISRNRLGLKTGAELAKALAAIKASSLNLSHNFLGDMTAEELAQALTAIKATRIDLRDNDIEKYEDEDLKKIFTSLINSEIPREIIIEPKVANRLQRMFATEKVMNGLIFVAPSLSLLQRFKSMLVPQLLSQNEKYAADIVRGLIWKIEDASKDKSRNLSPDNTLFTKIPELKLLQQRLNNLLDSGKPMQQTLKQLFAANNMPVNYLISSFAPPGTGIKFQKQDLARASKFVEQLIDYQTNVEVNEKMGEDTDLLISNLIRICSENINVIQDPNVKRSLIKNFDYWRNLQEENADLSVNTLEVADLIKKLQAKESSILSRILSAITYPFRLIVNAFKPSNPITINRSKSLHPQSANLPFLTIPSATMIALKKLSPTLPTTLSAHFAHRGQEIQLAINYASVKNDKTIVESIRQQLIKLEQDWNSIIKEANDPTKFCDVVENYINNIAVTSGKSNRMAFDLSQKKSTMVFNKPTAKRIDTNDLVEEIANIRNKFNQRR